MAVNRTVWVLGDAEASIFLEDEYGNIQGDPTTPILTYCFFEGVQLSSSTPIVRRAIPGRGRRKLVGPAGSYDEVQCSVDHLFYRGVDEYNVEQIFNPSQYLRIVLAFYKLEYTGIAPYENDTYYLTGGMASSYSISARMPEVVDATAIFEAELMVLGGPTGPTGPIGPAILGWTGSTG